jgi:hypothetical protein
MASSQNDLLQMLLRNAVTADNPNVAANAPDILSGNFQGAIRGAGGGSVGEFMPKVPETANIPVTPMDTGTYGEMPNFKRGMKGIMETSIGETDPFSGVADNITEGTIGSAAGAFTNDMQALFNETDKGMITKDLSEGIMTTGVGDTKPIFDPNSGATFFENSPLGRFSLKGNALNLTAQGLNKLFELLGMEKPETNMMENIPDEYSAIEGSGRYPLEDVSTRFDPFSSY